MTMVRRVEDYLAQRRALDFQLRIEGSELMRFAHYADESGHQGPVTTELALRWARLAVSASPLYRARRLEVVRTFARHRRAQEPSTEIPPRGILGPAHRRTQPYIYSEREITQLMAAARRLPSPKGLHGATYSTLLGLLACTGLRISEALRIECPDVDLSAGLIRIRETKFRKTRVVPLHRSATLALKRYAEMRDHTAAGACSFFSNEDGDPLPYSTVNHIFRRLTETATESSGSRRRLRLHDLRHTFACRALLRWYRDGVDVNHRVAALSTYLGHAKVSDTYWYLTGIPELMAIAARRFESFTERGRS
jgi:integrase